MSTRQFVTAPSRQVDHLIGVSQLDFGHHQRSIELGEHIQNPVSAWKIQPIALFAQLLGSELQEFKGIAIGNRVLIFEAG